MSSQPATVSWRSYTSLLTVNRAVSTSFSHRNKEKGFYKQVGITCCWIPTGAGLSHIRRYVLDCL